MQSGRLQAISERFNRFAEDCRRDSSPLYEKLCLGSYQDSVILELASYTGNRQPIPTLLLAAVHFLLLNGIQHDLASFYPTVSGEQSSDEDPYNYFRAFCLEYRAEIIELLSTNRVQSNVVERCSCLLPAFNVVAKMAEEAPLALVEIGASAGLNLYWDRYAYDYGEGEKYGDADSPVQILGSFRGENRPQISETLPKVSYRVGIDLNPIDVRVADAALWLKALVWPEHRARFQNLTHALRVAQDDPPTVVTGDAVEQLPNVLASVPKDSVLCIFHTHTTYQFSQEARDSLELLITEHARTRDLYWISAEYRMSVQEWLSTDDSSQMHPTLEISAFEDGGRTDKVLARCQQHGQWLEWLADSSF